MEIERQRVSQF